MWDSIVQLITVLLIFIFVCVLAYFMTRLMAGVTKGTLQGSNVEVLESFRIAQNKYLQVVRVGEKFYAYIVCKDTVTLLGELNKDDIPDLDTSKKDSGFSINFKEILEKAKSKSNSNGKDNG